MEEVDEEEEEEVKEEQDEEGGGKEEDLRTSKSYRLSVILSIPNSIPLIDTDPRVTYR
jgi:hypothetical protein